MRKSMLALLLAIGAGAFFGSIQPAWSQTTDLQPVLESADQTMTAISKSRAGRLRTSAASDPDTVWIGHVVGNTGLPGVAGGYGPYPCRPRSPSARQAFGDRRREQRLLGLRPLQRRRDRLAPGLVAAEPRHRHHGRRHGQRQRASVPRLRLRQSGQLRHECRPEPAADLRRHGLLAPRPGHQPARPAGHRRRGPRSRRRVGADQRRLLGLVRSARSQRHHRAGSDHRQLLQPERPRSHGHDVAHDPRRLGLVSRHRRQHARLRQPVGPDDVPRRRRSPTVPA